MNVFRSNAIDAIANLPVQLDHALAGLTPAQLTAHPITGEWSIAQNVHHLAEAAIFGYTRCKLCALEPKPLLQPYDQDVFTDTPDSHSADLGLSRAIVRSVHARWALLMRELPNEAFEKRAIHLSSGLQTTDGLLEIYQMHGVAHLDQIARTLAAQAK